MVRTHIFACSLPKAEADALNQESGRIYSDMLTWHYRTYRHSGHWLSPWAGKRLEDALGGPTTLHAHSRDAAQEGFYRACKTARACQQQGLDVRYPHQRKHFRTTIWKHTGIRIQGERMRLARARGLPPIEVNLPAELAGLPADAFREARLVWDRVSRRYYWHVVVEDGRPPEPPPGSKVAAGDPGEVHPMALTDGEEAVVISARALRAIHQYTAKRLAAIQKKQARQKKGSRRWKRLQRRKAKFLAQQKRRARDVEHKASRAVVDWAAARGIGTLALGDVRDVADGKRLHAQSQQKVGLWSHGRQRWYITYKAAAAGIQVALVNEAYSSQTCPECGSRHKPTGRTFRCPACGFVSPRDIVGSANILSRYLYGTVGHVRPPPEVKYRHPFDGTGKRSRRDTAQVAQAAPLSGGRV